MGAGKGQGTFDGFAVSVYDGKFSGGFDLEEDMAKDIGFDDVVTFIVTGRVGGVSFGETKVGDVKRTNSFQVVNSVALEPALAEKLLNSVGASIHGVNTGQLKIDGTVSGPGLVVDPMDDPPVPESATRPVDDPILKKFLEDHDS